MPHRGERDFQTFLEVDLVLSGAAFDDLTVGRLGGALNRKMPARVVSDAVQAHRVGAFGHDRANELGIGRAVGQIRIDPLPDGVGTADVAPGFRTGKMSFESSGW